MFLDNNLITLKGSDGIDKALKQGARIILVFFKNKSQNCDTDPSRHI